MGDYQMSRHRTMMTMIATSAMTVYLTVGLTASPLSGAIAPGGIVAQKAP